MFARHEFLDALLGNIHYEQWLWVSERGDQLQLKQKEHGQTKPAWALTIHCAWW